MIGVIGMTIETQIIRLHHNVEGFAKCVSFLNEELFLKKINGWSPRDIVAHLIGWNQYMIEGCKQIKKRELPFYDVDPGENYSKVNAVLIRKHSSVDKQELLDELRASARELEQFLESLDPGEWDRDYGVTNQGSTITIQSSVDDLIADYAHHTVQIEEWAKLTQSREGAKND
jgi:hypothetical protein